MMMGNKRVGCTHFSSKNLRRIRIFNRLNTIFKDRRQKLSSAQYFLGCHQPRKMTTTISAMRLFNNSLHFFMIQTTTNNKIHPLRIQTIVDDEISFIGSTKLQYSPAPTRRNQPYDLHAPTRRNQPYDLHAPT
jgi:hypothetical protein